MPVCARCGAVYEPPVYRTTLCSSCGSELKTCLNCRFYAPGAANDCREPVSEPVKDKERANFCDWFSPAENAFNNSGNNKESEAEKKAKDAFNSLFGDIES